MVKKKGVAEKAHTSAAFHSIRQNYSFASNWKNIWSIIFSSDNSAPLKKWNKWLSPMTVVTRTWRDSLRWREVKLSLATLSELRIQYTNIKSLQIVYMFKDTDDHLRRNKNKIMIY